MSTLELIVVRLEGSQRLESIMLLTLVNVSTVALAGTIFRLTLNVCDLWATPKDT